MGELTPQISELHRAATAYYNNIYDLDLRNKAWNFFKSMDTDGNGRVSYDEFVQFFLQAGYNFADRNFFRCLDRNQDGGLDFWEVLTLYYIMKTRGVWCNSCGVCQLGLYFTCVACFDNASHTYDLCTDCYSQRRYCHPHISFLDSYVLLRSKRGLPPGAPNLNQALAVPNADANAPQNPQTGWVMTALHLLDVALSVGTSIISQGCSIM
ncbi:hypothetical protein RGQ29_023210 [Quercus rubra]|uniref:EF-hand domain-containing protein n=1 Tax=Quercus rubra TaxID=3512 RepID=A0AAN7F4Q4_QUERU|nr:hypothetical protein RGQ29_023210 [Quercus rubra]